HQQGVDRVHGEGAHRLQNVRDCRRAGTRIAIVACHIGEQAADARTVWVLDKGVAVTAVAADRHENHRNSGRAEVRTGRDARRVVVYTADCDAATQIDTLRYRVFQPEWLPADFRGRDAFAHQIGG